MLRPGNVRRVVVSQPINVLLGGAGLVGSALHRRLRERGEETVVYDLKNGFDLREYELEDPGSPAYYWFLAWDVGGAKYLMDEARQLSILKHNLRLCERIFGWLEKRDAAFTFVSSQLSGYPNAYGATKAVGEAWTRLVGRGLVARLWNCYDAQEPSQRSHVIPDLIAQAQTGTIRLLTSGEERRQFTHVDDAARALILQRDSGQSVADITSGNWVSIRQVAEIIAQQFQSTVRTCAEQGYESLVDPSHPIQGWAPLIDLEAGISLVVARMREKGWMG